MQGIFWYVNSKVFFYHNLCCNILQFRNQNNFETTFNANLLMQILYTKHVQFQILQRLAFPNQCIDIRSSWDCFTSLLVRLIKDVNIFWLKSIENLKTGPKSPGSRDEPAIRVPGTSFQFAERGHARTIRGTRMGRNPNSRRKEERNDSEWSCHDCRRWLSWGRR
jgi:hypothetical protein